MTALAAPDSKRLRQVITPEGVPLRIVLATRGARLLALVLDYAIIFATVLAVAIALILIGINLGTLEQLDNGPGEFLIVIFFIAMFVLLNGYFIFFEMGPRGATPGKRLVGIRVAARPQGQAGERLTAEAIIARNLLRQIEIFLPLTFFQSAGDGGAAWIAGSLWFATFMLFPFFNRDALRAGDVVAGTWVVVAPRRKLADVLSLASAQDSAATPVYRFGPEELTVYGEYELQSLERVLRDGDEATLAAVHRAIVRKIGWEAGSGDERAFLEAFYTALRAKLEGDLRFGQRKADKHSALEG
ncbi:RDD family protein [Alteriqipengyuania lutimaris]|uniref:RDD family protein n=1 Tax=Alteriqipengyuania lutimaris TaxID=1538146 RepID=A0A395LHJ3_9SPHN|nr:RDD family protein [Alteriqipengyuania lutimaris]MBB3034815.1 putative RDD family membrane protein YckC [Alteriqipengyuania lutimaris]RDS76343.1 RDD family protein [Alteriqipengyuania lutimaris]